MTHKGWRVVKPQHNQNVFEFDFLSLLKADNWLSYWGGGGGGWGRGVGGVSGQAFVLVFFL